LITQRSRHRNSNSVRTQPTDEIQPAAINTAGRDFAQTFETAPPFSEENLALRFSEEHREDLRFTARWGRWSIWDGKRWERDDTLQVFDMVRALCRQVAAECIADPGTADDQSKSQAAQIARASTVAAVERLAKADRRHAMTVDGWDADPWLLNTPTGIVDLRTGSLRPAVQEDYCTKLTAASPGGECPLWLEFLDRITAGDIELQAFFQRMAGYALTGVTQEHALFFLYGPGANGKSVFINTISGLMGDYARTAPIETFIASTNERHPTDLAGLRGARLVTAVETEEGRRWAESKLKLLTGGDRISARFMRQDFFEFAPEFKLVIAGNHKPSLQSADEAMRRRFHMLPFTVTIPVEERNQELTENLRGEWGGILQWMIEGCLAWRREGLNPPSVVAEATTDYFAEEDVLGRWIEECCVLGPKCKAAVADLFENWKQWCVRNEEQSGSAKSFSQNLETRGYSRERSADTRCFRGIALKKVRSPFPARRVSLNPDDAARA
jgi:putative DNA primase/helicase